MLKIIYRIILFIFFDMSFHILLLFPETYQLIYTFALQENYENGFTWMSIWFYTEFVLLKRAKLTANVVVDRGIHLWTFLAIWVFSTSHSLQLILVSSRNYEIGYLFSLMKFERNLECLTCFLMLSSHLLCDSSSHIPYFSMKYWSRTIGSNFSHSSISSWARYAVLSSDVLWCPLLSIFQTIVTFQCMMKFLNKFFLEDNISPNCLYPWPYPECQEWKRKFLCNC